MRSLKCLALACWLTVSTPAFPQTNADVEAARRQADTLQRLQQERLRDDQERARRQAPAGGADTGQFMPKVDASASGKTCHWIREIEISGAPRLTDSTRADIDTRFRDKCLGVSEIEEILGLITRDYIQRGYITARAYLPAQDLTTGHLEIVVVEGLLGALRIEDGNRNSISKGNAFPFAEGEVLNLRDLEQGIDQINRLSSNNAQIDVQPGDKPGESVVVIRNEPRFPLHANMSFDNQGSEATGKDQLGLTLSLDNPLGFNDFISATHRESTPRYRGREYSGSDSFSYSIPFGYSTVSLATSRSAYTSTIRLGSGQEAVTSGSSKTSSLKLERVMYRDQASRATLSGTLTSKDSQNYLNQQYLAVSSRILSVLDLDASLSTGLLGGSITFGLGSSTGLNAMGAMKDAPNLPDEAPRAQFRKYRADINYGLPFRIGNQDFSFTSQYSSQRAQTTLYGSEQMMIGSMYSVRGFVKNALAGDHGYYWRNELSLRQPLVIAGQPVSARVYGAYDTGEVSNRVTGLPEGKLAGGAVGFSLGWRGVVLDWIRTFPLSGPDGMQLERAQSWMRLSISM